MTTQPVEQNQSSAAPDTPIEPIIVALAGAAGSPQALELFFRNLPDDTGISFIVTTRMGQKAINELPARLQMRTDMPVVTAVDGLTFQTDHVYVVPAGTLALFHEGQLQLHVGDQATDEEEGPLDSFFSSLAAQYGSRATAVLLSGTGSDGLNGLEQVVASGGLVFVQDPQDAAHGALPRRALARFPENKSGNAGNDGSKSGTEKTGTDSQLIIGTPGDLARQLIQQRGMLKIGPLEDTNSEAANFDDLYQEILEAIRVQTGHDLSHYKVSTLYRRVMRRMQMAGILEAAQYVNFLKSHEQESTALFKDSLVSVTSFYRDVDAYDMLERDCIPQLFAEKRRSDYVRVWIAGCATGEEAYSVAIQLMEYAAQLKEPPRFQIFATDLDEDAIAFARQGIYPPTIAKDMTPARFERFFSPENEGYRINADIREHVLFAVHDLLKDPPFSRLDLICCRNVLIYFNREAQEKVFAVFHYALNSSGYLFLGSSESVDSTPDLFAVVDKHCHLYQRRDVVNLPTRRLSPATLAIQSRFPTERKRGETESPAHTIEDLYTAWSLRVHTPARLLINESYDITHMFGDVHKFLQERQGAVTQNILERIHDDLRLDLQTALYPAFNKGERTISRLLQVEIDEVTHLIQLQVGPVQEPAFPNTLIEVVFVIQDSAPIFNLSMAGEAEHADLAIMTRMEEELMRTRERMQTVIEEYEIFSHELKTSNEELQSINEELKSTTEELETSKEELQSMNEELVTLNGELNHKIDELNRANSDLMNFIASTDVGAIFLDQTLHISRFTPRATELFNLIESDIRRPLSHITHRIHHTALADLAAHVRDTADHIEETVQSQDGHWYILRLFPYRTIENQIDGVVMTFVDISDLKRAESEERQRRQQQVLATLSRQALIGNDLDALFQTTTERVAQVLGMQLCKVLELQPDRESLLLRAGIGWDAGIVGQAIVPVESGSQAGYTLHAQGPVVVRDLQTEVRFHGPSLLTDHDVRSGMSVTIDGPDGPWGVLGVHDRAPRSFATYDVDFMQAVANTLAAAVTRRAHLDQLQFQANILAQINDAVIAIDNEQRITYLNTAATEQYAVADPTTVLGRPLTLLHTPVWGTPEEEQAAYTALEQTGSWRGENIHVRHDGHAIPVESTVSTLTEHDKAVGMLAVIRDVSEQKAAEEALRRSEARLQLATTVAGLAIIEIDYATELMQVSAEAAALFGIATEATTVPRATIHATFHPDDEAGLWQQINACLDPAGSGEFAMEHRVVWPDGTVRWLSVRKQVFFAYPVDAPAHPVRALLVAVDITERKAAEEALRASEERYRYLFETMDEGFCVVEILMDEAERPTDYRFLEANPAFEEFTGLEQVIGRTARDLVPGLEDHWVEIYGKVALTGEPVRFEQGSAAMGRWFNVSAFPVGDADKRRVAILFNNITERKQMEDALRISEANARRHLDELETIYNSAPIGLCVLDTEFRWVRINERLAEMNGYSVAEHIGHTVRELLPELADAEPMLRRLLESGEPIRNIEISGETPAQPGVERMWLESFFPLYDADGRIIGINVVAEEITEQKAAERALRESEELRRIALEGAQLGTWAIELANGTTFWDARTREIFGVSPTEEASTEKSLALVHPDDRRLVREAYTLATRPDAIGLYNTEVRLIRPDGSLHWIATRGRVQYTERDGQPQPMRLVGVIQDITERKEAEQTLQASEQQLRLITDNVSGLISYIDQTEHYRFVNGTYVQWFQQPPNAIIGTHIRENVGDAAYERVRPYVQRTLAGERTSFESTLDYPDGNRRTVLATYVPDVDADGTVLGFYALVTDITSRKQAEEQLRTSEGRLQVAMQAADFGIYELLYEPRQLYWSPELKKIFGLPVDASISADTTYEFAHPEDSDAVRKELQRAQNPSNDGRFTQEFRIVRQDGKIRWVYSRGQVYFHKAEGTEEQQPHRIVGLLLDITERKEMERALRTSEEQFRAVQQTTPDGFMIFASIRDEHDTIVDFRWLYINPAAEAMLGRPHEDLIGKQLLEEMPGNREEGIFDAYVQVVETGEVWQREFRYQHEGLNHWFRTTAAKTGDGFAVAFADITLNKEAEAALRASEERFRSAFEQAAVGMAHLDPDGNYLRVNDRLCAILGYSREELLQKNYVEITYPADLAADVAQAERLLAGEIEHHSMEKRYIRQDGLLLWVNMTASVVRDETGTARYSIAVIEDISARKAVEAALRDLNATLEERIAKRTAELEKSNAELERSNYDLDQFAYVASHDLKAPLRGIDSLAAWINEDAGAVLPEESKGHLYKLRARVQRMERLLEDLLIYSRIGRTDGQVETIDTARLLVDIIDLQAAPAGFTITPADDLPTLHTYRAPLELVFRNLIGNAIKHHHNPTAGEITIEAQNQDAFVQFTVSDNGPGIDEQHHKRIFLMFQTLRPRDEIEASGMGLAIVQRTVEHRGGSIWVESALGAGTKVHFTWPKHG